TFKVNATDTVTMGGVAVTRDTDPTSLLVPAGPGGTDRPAVKNYVDASIALSPLEATNQVLEHHTVTATVKEDLGDGNGQVSVPDGTHVVFTVTGDTADLTYFDANADSDNNALTADTVGGEATLTFTSSTPGTVTVNASTTFQVD